MSAPKRGRLLSVALTEPQVRDRTKTETRRLGWWTDKHGRRMVQPGDRLQLVRKAMGRKPDEPLVIVAVVRVTDVRREHLDQITQASVDAEGFPHWAPGEFVEFFCREMRCDPGRIVTVIQWTYLDAEVGEHVDREGVVPPHAADFIYLTNPDGRVQCLHPGCQVTVEAEGLRR